MEPKKKKTKNLQFNTSKVCNINSSAIVMHVIWVCNMLLWEMWALKKKLLFKLIVQSNSQGISSYFQAIRMPIKFITVSISDMDNSKAP